MTASESGPPYTGGDVTIKDGPPEWYDTSFSGGAPGCKEDGRPGPLYYGGKVIIKRFDDELLLTIYPDGRFDFGELADPTAAAKVFARVTASLVYQHIATLAANDSARQSAVLTLRQDVIDMISCAEEFTHNTPTVMRFLLGLLGGWYTDEEIGEFTAVFARPEMVAQGYTAEDAADTAERLRGVRAEYGKGEG